MNFKSRVRKYLPEGKHDQNRLKAIFLAGMPASGKTEFYNEVLKGRDLKHMDSDKIMSYFVKKDKGSLKDTSNYVKYQGKINDKLKRFNELYTSGKLGLVIDSTGANKEKITEIKRNLENKGYDTSMVFIKTPLQQSLDRAKKRERGVDEEYSKMVFNKLSKNAIHYESIFKNFWEINDRKDYSEFNKIISTWLRK